MRYTQTVAFFLTLAVPCASYAKPGGAVITSLIAGKSIRFPVVRLADQAKRTG